MQHFLFVESFQNFLIMGLFAGQKVGLWGNWVFPFLGVFLVLFVCFFRLFFKFLEVLFFLVDGLNLLLDFSDFYTIDPDVFTLFVWDELSKPDFVVANTLSHFVSFHFMTLYHIIEHLALACNKKFFFNFEFLLEKGVLLFKWIILSLIKYFLFWVGVSVLEVLQLWMRVLFHELI